MTSRCREMPAQKTAVETITFTVGFCAVGRILLATTAQGICAILLGSEERSLVRQLRSIFPEASLQKESKELDEMLNRDRPVYRNADRNSGSAPGHARNDF
jgi:hypothetical protein